MKRFGFGLLLLLASTRVLVSQNLSDSSFISLMTVTRGHELYSTFGHSALRVCDPINRIDRCYNYGTFDFDQPNFYLNFCRGKLLYSIDMEPYRYFERGNLRDARPMQQQVLRLDDAQKQRLFNLLETNALPENRNYKYDFFYDNCATRIRDIVQETFFYQMSFDSAKVMTGATMRQLLYPYLADQPWTRFGIDLVLGIPCDKKATMNDYMFLPDYLHHMFAVAKTPDLKPLVVSEQNIPQFAMPKLAFKPGLLDQPLFYTCLIGLIGLLTMANPRTERIFDVLFWFVLGIIGLVITLLWGFTDHSATKNNLNILWALPTHLLFFWRNKRLELTEMYFVGTAALAAITLVAWYWLPQQLPVAAIPIVVLVFVKGFWRRYWKKAD